MSYNGINYITDLFQISKNEDKWVVVIQCIIHDNYN